MDQMIHLTKEKFIADFNLIIADTEELLRATAGQAGEKVAEVRGRVQEHLAQAKNSLADAKVIALDKTKAVGRAADGYVQNNPWRSVSVAAGVGLIVGLLIGRR